MNRLVMRLIISAVLVLTLGLAGCGRQEQSREQDLVEVRKVLEIRDKAIETADMALYRSVIYPEYFDGGATLEQILSEMEDAFAMGKKIEFTYQKSPVEFKMNTARVVQRIIYRIEGREKASHGHERLILRKIEGKWIISGGIQTGLLQ